MVYRPWNFYTNQCQYVDLIWILIWTNSQRKNCDIFETIGNLNNDRLFPQHFITKEIQRYREGESIVEWTLIYVTPRFFFCCNILLYLFYHVTSHLYLYQSISFWMCFKVDCRYPYSSPRYFLQMPEYFIIQIIWNFYMWYGFGGCVKKKKSLYFRNTYLGEPG